MNFSTIFWVKRMFVFSAVFIGMIAWVYLGSGKQHLGQFFQSNAQFWYGNFVDGGEVTFKHSTKAEGEFDITVFLTSEAQKENAIAKARKEGQKTTKVIPIQFPINSWAYCGLFFVFLIAIILSAPVHWKRKGWTLLLGLPIVYVFVYFKLGLSIFFKFCQYYDRFEVGLNNAVLLKVLNSLHLMLLFPYFGLAFTLLVCVALLNNKNPNSTPMLPAQVNI